MRLFAVLLFFSNYCIWAQIEFVQIDTLNWSITNLSVTSFRNGDPIRNAKTREEWIQCLSDGIPAYCDYNNDSTIGNRFGHLYNWFAIADPRGLAPIGSRVSNNRDWSSLYSYINKDVFNWESKGLLCERLRSTEGWNSPKKGENWYDFNLLAGGYRNENGEFFGLGAETSIWVRDTLSYGVVLDLLPYEEAEFLDAVREMVLAPVEEADFILEHFFLTMPRELREEFGI